MATWQKGQPWRGVRSLDRLNEQIRAACPRAVPPATPVTSWGSIADDAHSTTSDHYPHWYTALGATAVVCARDFPHAPHLGLDIHTILDRIRLSRDPRVGYLISRGRITGPGRGWRWERYDGSDPHDTHGHVSSVHTARADDTSDWQIGLEEDDMAVGDDIYRLLEQGLRPPGTAQTSGGGVPVAWIVREIADIKGEQARAALRDEALLAAVTADDSAEVLARVDTRAAELAAAIAAVPAETVEALGDVDSPEQIAERLRAALGDKATAVGEILARG